MAIQYNVKKAAIQTIRLIFIKINYKLMKQLVDAQIDLFMYLSDKMIKPCTGTHISYTNVLKV